jgi:electron transport complex protein RnfB
MRGKRRKGYNRRRSGRRGGTEYCVCWNCGHKKPHQQRTPCYNQRCPVCGSTMVSVRQSLQKRFPTPSSRRTPEKRSASQSKKGKIPHVNREMCAGCGICVETCPVNAITLMDDRAKINRDTCTGCGACVSACPQDAISY